MAPGAAIANDGGDAWHWWQARRLRYNIALALSGCAASNEGGDAEEASGGVEAGSLSGQYTIGGASSQESAMTAWADGVKSVAPELTVQYSPDGSGAGREEDAGRRVERRGAPPQPWLRASVGSDAAAPSLGSC